MVAVDNLEQIEESPLTADDTLAIDAFNIIYAIVVGYDTLNTAEFGDQRLLMNSIQDVLVLASARTVNPFRKGDFTDWMRLHVDNDNFKWSRLGNSRSQLFENTLKPKESTTPGKRTRTRKSSRHKKPHPSAEAFPVHSQAATDVFIEL